jgi:hypothetical protein
MARGLTESRCALSPGLAQAPVMDVLCSHFVLTLTLRQAGRFHLRRDWNSLLSLVGPHIVWSLPVLGRVRRFLQQRCKASPQWRGHEALGDDAFVQRHGAWRGPCERGTLYFYIDEYIKDAPKDLLAVLGATCDWLMPGDFAAVRRQRDILGAAFEPDEFLSQLEGEHRVKPEVRQRRGIGFHGRAGH